MKDQDSTAAQADHVYYNASIQAEVFMSQPDANALTGFIVKAYENAAENAALLAEVEALKAEVKRLKGL